MNPFEKSLQNAQGTLKNIGQAMPVVGNSLMQNVGQGVNNVTQLFRGKKKKLPIPAQPKKTWQGLGTQIGQGLNNQKQQLDEINKETK